MTRSIPLVPTASGEAGILPNHAARVRVAPGLLSYSNEGIFERLAISGGFVEVNANKVSVLADELELRLRSMQMRLARARSCRA